MNCSVCKEEMKTTYLYELKNGVLCCKDCKERTELFQMRNEEENRI